MIKYILFETVTKDYFILFCHVRFVFREKFNQMVFCPFNIVSRYTIKVFCSNNDLAVIRLPKCQKDRCH
jgi:hypothetical protein